MYIYRVLKHIERSNISMSITSMKWIFKWYLINTSMLIRWCNFNHCLFQPNLWKKHNTLNNWGILRRFLKAIVIRNYVTFAESERRKTSKAPESAGKTTAPENCRDTHRGKTDRTCQAPTPSPRTQVQCGGTLTEGEDTQVWCSEKLCLSDSEVRSLIDCLVVLFTFIVLFLQ